VASQPPATVRLGGREVYANSWMRLREDTVRRLDGSTGIYSVVDKPDFALVIARDGERYQLVEQFRYPVGARCMEFPQGSAPEDDPLVMAQRELAEETGVSAEQWAHLGRLWTAYGFCSQAYDVWLAEDLTFGAPALEPEEQDLRSLWVQREELEAMFSDGRIGDAHSIAAYALLVLAEARGDRSR
jgi:8-oxo-dGTP pyrophosphatase MutT (NUDIX family)